MSGFKPDSRLFGFIKCTEKGGKKTFQVHTYSQKSFEPISSFKEAKTLLQKWALDENWLVK